MRTFMLTGLATEHKFTSIGEAQYYLVFNEGDLRVAISEEAAAEVIEKMYGNSPSVPEASEPIPVPTDDYNESNQDEDGIDQI